MRWINKNFANTLSIIRIILSFYLLLLTFPRPSFLFIYGICGLTDILDGYIARKTNSQSFLGAKLDSIGDFILFIVVFYCIIVYKSFEYNILYFVVVIFIIRIINVLVIFLRYKTFAMLHTIGNKITGIILFLLPFFISSPFIDFFIKVILIISLISSIEETFIVLMAKELDINTKGILFKENI